MPTVADLEETARQVETLDQRIVWAQADVRDLDALQSLADRGTAELGPVDVVVANAGVWAFGPLSSFDITPQRWADVIGTNLTGVYNTLRSTVPAMIDRGAGGSVVMTSSTAGLRGLRSMADYTASKHGVVGLMRTFANELAEHSIRVNSVHPTGVSSPMVVNPVTQAWFASNPAMGDNASANLLPVELVEPRDISEAVLWLASDASRYVTGVALPVDAGFSARVLKGCRPLCTGRPASSVLWLPLAQVDE
jgi:NAD(P)-dependent dehydrogenase (short-subunit alcohol dehydrogenase family)